MLPDRIDADRRRSGGVNLAHRAHHGSGHPRPDAKPHFQQLGHPYHPDRRILLRHILPNVLAPIVVQATLAIAAAVIAEASLSFLGLGQQPPAPSWGSMRNTATHFLSQAPWMAVWPGLAIFSLVLSFNLLADGLRDALDPRQN